MVSHRSPDRDESEHRRTDGTIAERRVLVLAYYFPPMGLSGVQRTAKFVKYLPDFGWRPTVLTCEPAGYYAYDRGLLEEVLSAGVCVERVPSWDPTRLFGHERVVPLLEEPQRRRLSSFSQFFFVPDNKLGWLRPAVKRGLRLLKDHRFDLIFSTAPPYTSHVIGARLARASGVPLVLDFRDDWLGNPRHTYPTPIHRALTAAMERRALRAGRRFVVINEAIRERLLERNRDVIGANDVAVIPHGFDPADFESRTARRSEKFTLLYSGIFYDAQTPEYFLRALASLLRNRPDLHDKVEAVFAGLVPKSCLDLVRDLGLGSHVNHLGYVPHDEVVDHLLAADVLWMTVGRRPGADGISTGKLFEYAGTRKPILGLVPPGSARAFLEEYAASVIVEPDDVVEISTAIGRLYDVWETGRLAVASEDFVRRFDRRRLAGCLASLFDGVHGPQDGGAVSARIET